MSAPICSGDDMSGLERIGDIVLEGFNGAPVAVACDRKAQDTANSFQFCDPHRAELWIPKAQITKAKGDVRRVRAKAGAHCRPRTQLGYSRRKV